MTTEPSIGWLGTGKMGSVMAGRSSTPGARSRSGTGR